MLLAFIFLQVDLFLLNVALQIYLVMRKSTSNTVSIKLPLTFQYLPDTDTSLFCLAHHTTHKQALPKSGGGEGGRCWAQQDTTQKREGGGGEGGWGRVGAGAE